ncbi:MAG: hypothetical protein FJ348_00605 [Sphingomonadales bacterium]|nr:hypothetical protein [Sphingomonadales bacterium]
MLILFRLLFCFATTFLLCTPLHAQYGEQPTAEIGVGIGAAHYFGDLNATTKLNRPGPSATIFFRKNLGNYIAARASLTYAQLGFADSINTQNEVMQKRNLGFTSAVWEVALQGDFNFFRFVPGDPGASFTPYITLGVGVFGYNPYTEWQNQRYYFRELPVGTEGQNSTLYPERKMYGPTALSIPFGGGIKYALLGGRMNIAFEILHRFTNTDYLDDVSSTYVEAAAFPKPPGGISVAQALSDRSGELGIAPIGLPGRERGNGSRQKDQFVTALLSLSFNLSTYRCPTAD